MNIIIGIGFIILGVLMLFNPDAFLRMEDSWRVKGERTYSDTAIFFTRLSGIFLIIIGVVFLFDLVSIFLN